MIPASEAGSGLPSVWPSGVDEPSVFRLLFLAYPDSLLLVDRAGTILLANPSAAKLLGYAPGELVGLPVEALVPDGIRPRHAAYRQAYGDAPRPRPMGMQMDLVAKRKDGSEVLVEIALSPLQQHGLPLVVAAIRDIGAYPRVKQALQRARYSESLAQFGKLAVDTRDIDALLHKVPQIAAEALQVEVARLFLLEGDGLAFRVAGAFGEVDQEAVGDRVPNRADTPPGFILARGEPVLVDDYRGETRFTVPAGYLKAGLVSALAVPLSDRGRVIGAFTVRSAQPQRFGDEEQRFMQSLANLVATSLQRSHSEEALNHAQRLESVGQLTGGIAHDFNNLLTVIQGNMQVLEETPALAGDPHAQQLVKSATRATRRAAELTGKLLAFSRRQVLQPAPVDVPALVNSLADMLRRTLDQHIRIEVDLAADCPQALADPGQLEAALLNVAINARDAMPDGGRLRFRAAGVRALPPELHREWAPSSGGGSTGFVAIAISDTGTGMPDAVKERAFEPFFTTKPSGRGTGLGLSTVYGFVAQSHGAVRIESSVGAGTTVTLYIPQPQAAAAAREADDGPGEVPAGLSVLLVEDDPEVRRVVRAFLDAMRCRVSEAATAEQALLLIGASPRFDLLLSDIALGPGMRGTELAATLRERAPGIAVLLMSGFSADLVDADSSAPPDWELLQKPYTRSELTRAIARLFPQVERGNPDSP